MYALLPTGAVHRQSCSILAPPFMDAVAAGYELLAPLVYCPSLQLQCLCLLFAAGSWMLYNLRITILDDPSTGAALLVPLGLMDHLAAG
ncbi:uncharacterized protein J3R85_020977 [Psidium guajava]|nr:uncharacterized protein J3R85_020977 [Psidium guajava]